MWSGYCPEFIRLTVVVWSLCRVHKAYWCDLEFSRVYKAYCCGLEFVKSSFIRLTGVIWSFSKGLSGV